VSCGKSGVSSGKLLPHAGGMQGSGKWDCDALHLCCVAWLVDGERHKHVQPLSSHVGSCITAFAP
jgi:hypothetical protein